MDVQEVLSKRRKMLDETQSQLDDLAVKLESLTGQILSHNKWAVQHKIMRLAGTVKTRESEIEARLAEAKSLEVERDELQRERDLIAEARKDALRAVDESLVPIILEQINALTPEISKRMKLVAKDLGKMHKPLFEAVGLGTQRAELYALLRKCATKDKFLEAIGEIKADKDLDRLFPRISDAPSRFFGKAVGEIVGHTVQSKGIYGVKLAKEFIPKDWKPPKLVMPKPDIDNKTQMTKWGGLVRER